MSAPYFLTLAPIASSLPAQTVAFSPSDHLQLLLGGVYLDYYRRRRPPHHTADFIFDEQHITPDHCDLTLFRHTPYLTNRDRDGTTRVNEHPLQKDERVQLSHGDEIEIGHLDEYSVFLFGSIIGIRVSTHNSDPFIYNSSDLESGGRAHALLLPRSARSNFHSVLARFDHLGTDFSTGPNISVLTKPDRNFASVGIFFKYLHHLRVDRWPAGLFPSCTVDIGTGILIGSFVSYEIHPASPFVDFGTHLSTGIQPISSGHPRQTAPSNSSASIFSSCRQ
ncbi:hypothetical protein CF319_g5946 [Tilletia indica]|nr:hypothetical protein CF319_g5946 [Tilletia indica]